MRGGLGNLAHGANHRFLFGLLLRERKFDAVPPWIDPEVGSRRRAAIMLRSLVLLERLLLALPLLLAFHRFSLPQLGLELPLLYPKLCGRQDRAGWEKESELGRVCESK